MASQDGSSQNSSDDTVSTLTFRSAPLVTRSSAIPKKAPFTFEYDEHAFLGDAITLQGVANPLTFELPNTLKLTYGQINALAGDFYGTAQPISDGVGLQQQQGRFLDAWNTLAVDTTRQPEEAEAIINLLQTEVDAINAAIKNGEDPSIAYSQLPSINYKLEAATYGRPTGTPAYLGLALINWDHFGADAHTAYAAGHSVALQEAADANGNLQLAYAMNAFADHFLEDSFSAGHARTPRRQLHGDINLFYDKCAQCMHDEDCAIGLAAKNKRGDEWTMYGDKRLLDQVDTQNKAICQEAIQASADEIYAAWQSKTVPGVANYAFWKIVPDLEVALGNQQLAALFQKTLDETPECSRRINVTDRRTAEYTKVWTAAGTYATCTTSGWWDYPITINGPQ